MHSKEGLDYMYVDNSTLEFDNASGLSIYHWDSSDGTKEYVEIGVNGSPASSYAFKIYSLKDYEKDFNYR